MGERDNHIDQGTGLSPEEELLTHRHGEKERVVDGEVQPRGDDGSGGHYGDGGHDPWGSDPRPPSSSLEMVLDIKLGPNRVRMLPIDPIYQRRNLGDGNPRVFIKRGNLGQRAPQKFPPLAIVLRGRSI